MSEPPVYSVTSARTSLTDDQLARNKRYMLSMSIRVICFILCIVTDGWLRWTFFVGALVLPWVAVVIANAGREQRAKTSTTILGGPNELNS